MALSDDQSLECPLCMEPFEMDDFNFFPCTCGYQICRFCWHRIRTDENGLCPACRKQYPEDPADFKPLSAEELQRIKSEKRQKDQQRKQKISDCRKHLANVRVVQKNLVFVVGLPTRLADADVLKKHDYFGKFGKMLKVVVNQSTTYAGSQGPSASAYVTYCKQEDALRAIKSVNNIQVDGRTLKASLGTTKYCSHFLKSQLCPKTDCMYLHELGDEAASFTKEDMQQGKHQEYEKKLQDQITNCNNRKGNNSLSLNQKSEAKSNKSRDSVQNQKADKPNRSKAKHSGSDSQRSKKSKNRTTDSSHNSANTNKDDNSAPKKNQKQSRHTKGENTNNVLLQRIDFSGGHSNKTVESLERNMKNTHTTFVEITEQPLQNHLSTNIKIARSASPSLPASPASSSSSSLFTPFGSLSSNFLSSSPSPPPPPSSSISQSFQGLGNTITTQDTSTVSTYAIPSTMENNRSSPRQLYFNQVNGHVFSHLNNAPVSDDLEYYNNHHTEEIDTNGETDWNSGYQFDSPSKQLEDDLDFDPWDESSKGLADLMAKEADTNMSYTSASMPPGFSSFKSSVPSNQRIGIPPPGFHVRQQMPSSDNCGHINSSYMANQAFNSKLLMNEKRQSFMEAFPHLYQQQSRNIQVNQCSQFSNRNSGDVHSQLVKEFLRMRQQATIQENFRALLPNINVSFGSPNFPKSHNQNAPSWNSQVCDLPWMYGDSSMLNSGSTAESQFGSNCLMTPNNMSDVFQDLSVEDTFNVYSGHTSYTPPYALRGQWPTSSPCPPPGFVAPSSSSSASNPFQQMQVNQNI